MSTLGKNDADLFTSLCRCAWTIDGKLTRLIFNSTGSAYTDIGINFTSLTHLESLGLIRFAGGVDGYHIRFDTGTVRVSYFGDSFQIVFREEPYFIDEVKRCLAERAKSSPESADLPALKSLSRQCSRNGRTISELLL